MTGDFTRDTFRPLRHFSAVRQQQGRVHLDADWNEQVDIGHHIARVTSRDVIGPTGMPEEAPGFLISPASADLLIGFGRAYVDGVLVENEASVTKLAKVSGAGANTIWEVTQGPRLLLNQWIGPAPTGPAAPVSQVAAIEAPQQGDNGRQRVRFSQALAGVAIDVVALTSALLQPDLPGATLPAANGFYLAYIDLWEREITALEDATIAETALGGIDTAIRTRVVWQVKFFSLAAAIANGQVGNPPVCKSFAPGWSPDPASALKIAAYADQALAAANPCELPAEGGYRSLENHLYRVEIHKGGVQGADEIFLKWSRDNAIHRTRLLDVVDKSLLVEDTGRDDATAIVADDWLELKDEGRILRGEPGFFIEIEEVAGTRLGIRTILHPDTLQPVVQAGEPDAAVLPKAGLLRRWEGGAPTKVTPGQPFALENGLAVKSLAGADKARIGDYWLIPARSLTAAVEWPKDPATGDSQALPPQGVKHRFCPLAIVEKSAGGFTVSDCRPIFPPLTKLESFFYLGGDGQMAMPDFTAPTNAAFVLLPSLLRTGVARGRAPVAGRAVRFRVSDQGANLAKLSAPPGADVISAPANGLELILRTGADGVAAAALAIHRDRRAAHVIAELLDAVVPAQASPIHLPIEFTAAPALASEVAYDPKNCAYQSYEKIDPGLTKTVQSALDKLCPRIEFLPLGGDGQTLCVGKPAPSPLVVAAFWGKAPLKGASVGFRVVAGDAKVNPDKVAIDDKGVAQTTLIAGDKMLDNDGVVLVEATLLDAPQVANPAKLTFTARFLNAACVFVGPEVCPPGQKATKSNTVASLISYLCETGGGGKKGFSVKEILRIKSANNADFDTPLVAYEQVAAALLEKGVFVSTEADVDPESVKRGEVGYLIMDLPFAVVTADILAFWANDQRMPPLGAQPTKLDGEFQISRVQPGLVWMPSRNAMNWLKNAPGAFARLGIPFALRSELVLMGSRIYARGLPRVYLDGKLYFDGKEAAGVRYPSGDGNGGGDLRLPFTIV
jgi:hypothetical protein